jgi:hypothetical protein
MFWTPTFEIPVWPIVADFFFSPDADEDAAEP